LKDLRGFLSENKEAKTARAQRHVRLFADAVIGQKDRKDSKF